MRKLTALVLCLLMAAGQLWAQNRTVKGKVTDDNGKPVANASVLVKGTTTGTTTAADGTFSLSVPETAKTLVVSSLNFGLREISVSGKSQLSIALSSTVEKLDEVIVVGYGTKNIREVTGSISKIDGAKIAAEPVTSFNQGLAGKTAGVQVNLSTGLLADRTTIRVRGVNSISLSSQPLIVIDGVPNINTSNLNGFNGGNGNRFDPLSLINSADIESIEILKDAGAAVIYGSQASSGVILITTKKGKKGNIKVSFDSKAAWSTATKLPSLLNGDQFIAIANEKAGNRYAISNPGSATPAKESDVNGDGVNDRVDWNSILYRTGMMTDNTVSFSGGADKLSVYGSFRYLNQEGIVLANKLRTGQARLNMDFSPKTWFKAGINMAYVRTLANGILSDTYIAGTTVSGWQALPTISPFDPTKSHGYNLTTAGGLLSLGNNTPVSPTGATLLPGAAYYYNGLAVANMNRNDNTATDTKVSIYGELQPVKGLKINSRFGVQYQSNFEDQYTSPFQAGLGLPYGGLNQTQTQNFNQWTWQTYASYDKTFKGIHKIGIVAGTEFQKFRFNSIYTGAGNFTDPFFTTIVGGAYTNTQPGSTTILDFTGGDNSNNGSISYFGRLNYAYKGKYLIEGSFRRDGFSAFGANNEFGNFPSVSLGWEITKEKFMSGISWLEFLKVRGSIGTVGNRRGMGDFANRTLYSGAAYTSLNGLGISQQGNAGLKWESAKKFDIGFEATLLKGKLGIVVDYFKNDINEMILNAPALYTVGIPNSSLTKNIGGMTNKGIEITVKATPVSTRNFTWEVSANYTKIKNKVNGLVPENGNADIQSVNQVASLDRDLGTYRLPVWAGVNSANGNPMWYAANGSIKMYNFPTGTWTDDKGTATTALGTADFIYVDGKVGLPQWYGGFDNNFKYKQFDLGVSITFSGGNYLYNQTKASMLTNFFSNNFSEIMNRWTTPGQVTEIPRLYQSDNTANQASTRFLEKGDYARVRTITLGYNVPKTLLTKWGFDNIRFYVQSFNPFTITNYSGLDPDVNFSNSTQNNNIAIGTDNRATPQVRTMTVGANITF